MTLGTQGAGLLAVRPADSALRVCSERGGRR